MKIEVIKCDYCDEIYQSREMADFITFYNVQGCYLGKGTYRDELNQDLDFCGFECLHKFILEKRKEMKKR